jgi:hypothetical protein
MFQPVEKIGFKASIREQHFIVRMCWITVPCGNLRAHVNEGASRSGARDMYCALIVGALESL